MKTLILTVGLPRSGKSTWCEEQIKKANTVVVRPDAVRLAFHGERFKAELENEVWEIVYIMTRALLLSGHDTIIIDATSVNERSRNAWKKEFKDCKVVYKNFYTSPEICKERAILTNQKDLLPVIDRMASKLVFPKEDLYDENNNN